MTNYTALQEIKDSQLLVNGTEIIDSISPKYKKIKLNKNNKLIINNDEDFYNAMDCLRFHMVQKLPYEIFSYLKTDNYIDISKYNDFFFNDLLMCILLKRKIIKSDSESLAKLQHIVKKSIAQCDAQKIEKKFKNNIDNYGYDFLSKNKHVIDEMTFCSVYSYETICWDGESNQNRKIKI